MGARPPTNHSQRQPSVFFSHIPTLCVVERVVTPRVFCWVRIAHVVLGRPLNGDEEVWARTRVWLAGEDGGEGKDELAEGKV